jgi:phosphohistidine phosphatase
VKLWLLRHGQAEARARTDALRELTAQGRLQVIRSSEALLGRPLVAIVSSPYVRAQQTARLVADALAFSAPIVTVPWLIPEADTAEVLRCLDAYADAEVLLVTHQPLVGTLAGLLLDGHRQTPLPMQTASLAQLDGEFAAPGLMRLTSLQHQQ